MRLISSKWSAVSFDFFNETGTVGRQYFLPLLLVAYVKLVDIYRRLLAMQVNLMNGRFLENKKVRKISVAKLESTPRKIS